jgi:hypothetical protein
MELADGLLFVDALIALETLDGSIGCVSNFMGQLSLSAAGRDVARKLEIPDALKLYCARHTFGTVAMAETKNPGLVKEVRGMRVSRQRWAICIRKRRESKS